MYAHSTETRSSAPTAVILRLRGRREGNICFLAWGSSVVSLLLTLQLYPGTRVVPLVLTFYLYAWCISIVSFVLTLQLFLGY